MATRVLGLDKLKRKLKELPEAARAEIAAAMEKSASEMVSLAKSLVPVDDGTLRESIGWTWGDPPKGARVIASGRTRLAGNMVITVYAGSSEAFYARWMEFGTAPHINAGRYPGTQHPGTTPQPFFFVAYRSMRKRARGRMTRAINRAAKRVASGG